MQYSLVVQFTLHVVPEEEPFYHQTSVVALLDACKSPASVDLLGPSSQMIFSGSDVSQLLRTSTLPVPSLGSASRWSTGLSTTGGRSPSTQTR